MRIITLFCTLILSFASAADAKTVATVNGTAIDSQELQRSLHEFATSRGVPLEALQQSPQFARLQQVLLESLVQRELLWQAARKRYRADDAQVNQALNGMRSQFGGDERFQQALQAQGLTEKVIEERLRHDLTIQAYVQKEVYAGVEVDDAEIRAYYEANRDKYRSPDLLHLRDILVPSKKAEDQARSTAEQLHQKLAMGADFATLAHKHSADVSARSGGDLGFLNAEDLGEQLAPVAQALSVGAVSEPHDGPGGVHLLQLLARHPGVQATADQMHDLIRGQLLEARRNEALEKRLKALRAQAKVQILN